MMDPDETAAMVFEMHSLNSWGKKAVRSLCSVSYMEGYAEGGGVGICKGLGQGIVVAAEHAGAQLSEAQLRLIWSCDDRVQAERWLREVLETGRTEHIAA